jgi:tetratricopeptide (TPR) repeat protein
MARERRNRLRRRKPPSLNQRLKAQAKRGAIQGDSADGTKPRHKPDVRINKAQALWDRRLYDEAIWQYERALARDPHNPVLLVDVARAYALRFRYADAEKLVELAQRLHGEDAYLQQMLGRSYVLLQQFDRAIACYRRSLELATASSERPQVLLELAKMYERLHDLQAARQCADEALEIAPGFEKARYELAHILHRLGETEAAQVLWHRLVDERRAPPGVIADSLYELAVLHDRAGRYDEAFDSLMRAKEIVRRAAGPCLEDAQVIARATGKTFAAVTPVHCQQWNAAAAQLKPLSGPIALLTSHPRSGTTLLEQVLDSHPKAISADELQIMSELVFAPLGRKASKGGSMVEILDTTTPAELDSLRTAYWSGMEGALRQSIGSRLMLDKNPALTGALPVVARVFPEMKILFAIRDPRDVVISCFMQRLPLNPVSVHYLTLEETAKQYARTMSAWLKFRGTLQNPWMEVRYEDTVADIEQQARNVLGFLNLPWDDAVLQYRQTAQRKHVHSPTYEAVTRPLYTSSIQRWRNYAAQLEPCMEILQPFVKEFGYD